MYISKYFNLMKNMFPLCGLNDLLLSFYDSSWGVYYGFLGAPDHIAQD